MPGKQAVTERVVPLPRYLAASIASYGHVASCAACLDYAGRQVGVVQDDSRFLDADAWSIVAATLSHHDSGHRRDDLLIASQHFGVV